MKFGIIKEGKNPPDKRVVLTPKACKALKETFQEMEYSCEKSENRTFADQEYINNGIEVDDDVSMRMFYLVLKKCQLNALIPNKKYFFLFTYDQKTAV